jgi:hypothetical protein
LIGRRLNVPVVSLPPEESAAHFGWLAGFAGLDLSGSSELTQAKLGWRATGPGVIADLDAVQYFEPGTNRVVAAR